jgi:transcription-repair coupling factor (superfamily II helicase)
VGRGHVRARAVLLIPPGPLPDVAVRRLSAIEELSQLGAGFKIALKDLEIRGAGNILGAEQHGHIAAVGYELYCRLLRQTILRMKGMADESDAQEVDLDIRVDAYLPPAYIPDESLRMEFLRKLSRCTKPEAVDAVREELLDRFGRMPEHAERLLDVCLVRILMRRCGLRRIASALRRPHLVVEVFDERRYAAADPFKRKEMRFIEPGLAHLHPPRTNRSPVELLRFLKSRLLAAGRKLYNAGW